MRARNATQDFVSANATKNASISSRLYRRLNLPLSFYRCTVGSREKVETLRRRDWVKAARHRRCVDMNAGFSPFSFDDREIGLLVPSWFRIIVVRNSVNKFRGW